jgi:hypothetical protein
MFQSLIATTATWFTLPCVSRSASSSSRTARRKFRRVGRAGLGEVHGRRAPFGFHAPGVALDGHGALAELVGGCSSSRTVDARRGVLPRHHDARRDVRRPLERRFLFEQPGIEYTVALLGMSLALLDRGRRAASPSTKDYRLRPAAAGKRRVMGDE